MSSFHPKAARTRSRHQSLLLLWLLAIPFAPQRAQAVSGTVSATSYGFSTGNTAGTNDTDLQNALNSGAAVVTVPTGAYSIGSTTINVPVGVSLQGVSGTQFNLSSSTNTLFNMLSHSSLWGITFNCSAVNSSSAPSGVTLPDGNIGVVDIGNPSAPGVEGVTVASCTFNNSVHYTGVYVQGQGGPSVKAPNAIQGCVFNTVWYGISTYGAWNLHVFYNTVNTALGHGMIFWGLNSSGNHLTSRGSGNIDCEYNAVTNVGTDHTNVAAGIWCTGCENIVFDNNTVTGATDGGLDMEWTSQGRMCHNAVSGALRGGIAMFYSSEDIVIADNNITNNVQDTSSGSNINAGVFLANENTTQYVEDTGYKNVTIYGNTINNTAGGAWQQRWIWLDSNTSSNLQVYNNHPQGTGYYYYDANQDHVSNDGWVINGTTGSSPSGGPYPVIGDASFEMPSITAGSSAQAPTDVFEQYLTFGNQSTGNTSGIAKNGSGLSNPTAPDGTQAGYVQGSGSISHSVWFPEGQWEVTFSSAQQTGTTNKETVQVLIDGTALGSYTPGTSFASTTTSAAALTQGFHVLTFQGTGASGSHYAFIDKISFVPGSGASSPNFVQNTGFEAANSLVLPWAWNCASGFNATNTVDTLGTDAHWGTNSAEFTCSSPYTSNKYGSMSQGLSGLTVGQTYYLSFWARGSGVGSGEEAVVGTNWATNWVSIPSGTYGWSNVTESFVADATSEPLNFLIQDYTTQLWIDDVSVTTQPVRNSGFDVTQMDFGDSQSKWGYTNGTVPPYTLDSTVSHSGGSSVSLSWYGPLTGGVYGNLYQTVSKLTVGHNYVLTAWVKGNNVGSSEQLATGDSWGTRASIPSGTYGWTKVTLPFTADDSSAEPIEILMQDTTSDLWVDDVTVTPA